MPYTIEGLTQDCYSGTTVLVNKLNIRDPGALAEVEGTLVAAKAAQWEIQPLTETFDFAHYCSIHRYLFEDLYSWAGQVRRVDISKQGTLFCPAAQIPSVADAIFARLRERSFLCGMDEEPFLSAFVDFYERTNELHPFREGNGRTQRVFLSQLAHHAGYSLDFTRIDPDDLMIATTQAAHGVDDFLRELFHEMLISNGNA